MGFFKKWIRQMVADENARQQGMVTPAVGVHEINNLATRAYQVWEIRNGLLLVSTTDDGYGNSLAQAKGQALTFYPDLKSLYEGMATDRALQKMGVDVNVTYPAQPTSAGIPLTTFMPTP